MLAFASQVLDSKLGISRNGEVEAVAITFKEKRATLLASKNASI